MVIISYKNQTLFAGSTISLTCTAWLNDAVDSSVSLHFTWLNGSTAITNDTNRASIFIKSETMPSFVSVLKLSPLSDTDSTYEFKCQAIANSSSDYITVSDIGENSAYISVTQRRMLP